MLSICECPCVATPARGQCVTRWSNKCGSRQIRSAQGSRRQQRGRATARDPIGDPIRPPSSLASPNTCPCSINECTTASATSSCIHDKAHLHRQDATQHSKQHRAALSPCIAFIQLPHTAHQCFQPTEPQAGAEGILSVSKPTPALASYRHVCHQRWCTGHLLIQPSAGTLIAPSRALNLPHECMDVHKRVTKPAPRLYTPPFIHQLNSHMNVCSTPVSPP